MNKILLAALFYVFFVLIYIGFVQMCDASIICSNYVPTPHFEKNTPAAFKQLFFMVSQDGENIVPPTTNSDIIFHGSRNSKEVALTFDADMTPWMKEQLLSGSVQSYYNQQLINYLDQTQTKATLFLTGMWIELYPDVAKQLASDSLFELGNHSYSHPSFSGECYGLSQISFDEKQQEIEKTQQLLFDLTHQTNTLFRFPGGCYSQDDIVLLQEDGIQAVGWDVVGNDGFNSNTQAIVANVLNNIQNGSIIVMHMNGYPNDPKTSEAVPEIIQTLKQQGYTFVTVGELLSQKQNLTRSSRELKLIADYLL